MPRAERYDGYPQYENGVGMIRVFEDELLKALTMIDEDEGHEGELDQRIVSMATGKLAYPFINQAAEDINLKYPHITIWVYAIENIFFGSQITVAGLLTGQDIVNQLGGKVLGEELLLPDVMLKADEAVFLDGMSVDDMEKALQVKINIVKSSGWDFLDSVIGRRKKE